MFSKIIELLTVKDTGLSEFNMYGVIMQILKQIRDLWIYIFLSVRFCKNIKYSTVKSRERPPKRPVYYTYWIEVCQLFGIRTLPSMRSNNNRGVHLTYGETDFFVYVKKYHRFR